MEELFMKNILILSLGLISFAACQQQREAEVAARATTAAEPAPEQPVATPAEGDVKIHVGSAFSPASITVPQGKPVRLAFHRTDEPTCADEVVFPDLKLRKKLPANATTVVELPPQQARTLSFACGMDMMKGTVVVQ
jgi:plastocyanin domain-containing protein